MQKISYISDLRKPNTPRDKKYMAWIRTLPCVNGHQPPSAPHHEGNRGMGIKASDYETIPLCNRCHGERHQVGKSIWGLWGKDPVEIISRLQATYTAKLKELKICGTKPIKTA